MQEELIEARSHGFQHSHKILEIFTVFSVAMDVASTVDPLLVYEDSPMATVTVRPR